MWREAGARMSCAHLGGELAVAVDIQLVPLRLTGAPRGHHLIERARRQRGAHLNDALGAGRTRQHHFALNVEK